MRRLTMWLASRRRLHEKLLRLQARLQREEESREVLTRQRDTLLDCLDRVAWDARRDAATAKAVVEHLGRPITG